MTAAIWTHEHDVSLSLLIAGTGRPGERMITCVIPIIIHFAHDCFEPPFAFGFLFPCLLFFLLSCISTPYGDEGTIRLCRSELRMWRLFFGGGFLRVFIFRLQVHVLLVLHESGLRMDVCPLEEGWLPAGDLATENG